MSLREQDNEIVGRYFAGWDGHIYWCESEDAQGFWMTRIDVTEEQRALPKLVQEHQSLRRNVSERAIGRTYHHIWEDDGNPYTALQGWTGRERYIEAKKAHKETLCVNWLAQELDLHPTAVRRSLANLKARGLIEEAR